METARGLLAAALADTGKNDEIILQVHPPTEGHPALLIMHVHAEQTDYAALRRRADQCAALVSGLAEREFLIRFQPGAAAS